MDILPEKFDFMAKLTSGGEEVAIAIGVIEILGAIGLLFAASRFYVSILLILIMVASIGSTIGGKLEFAKALWPTVVLFILALVAYYDNAIAAEEEEEEIEHRNDR
jgi:ABC-type Na+ efflux pump permease subunit